VLVREPDQLRVERVHPHLVFGVRLVELAKPNRHVAANDDRASANLDDDDLHAACVARRRDEPEPGKQLEFDCAEEPNDENGVSSHPLNPIPIKQ